jgi:Protein of unknown function (DUF3617)
MRYQLLLVLIVCSSLCVLATDAITPLNVREGLWEVTVTHSMSGAPAVPPDVLANMTPEQRARIADAMKQSGVGEPKTDVRKECITKEKLAKHLAFSSNRGECTRTVVSSTGSKLELKIHCEEKQNITDGALVLEALNSDSVKGTMHSVVNSSGRNMIMNFTFTSKYLGETCGDVK